MTARAKFTPGPHVAIYLSSMGVACVNSDSAAGAESVAKDARERGQSAAAMPAAVALAAPELFAALQECSDVLSALPASTLMGAESNAGHAARIARAALAKAVQS